MNDNRPLWAPWRIDYILGDKKDGCFMCDKSEIKEFDAMVENHIVARGEKAFIILNSFPYSSGHLMVCPYQHVKEIGDLPVEVRNEIMELCVRAQQILTDLMNPDGFNIGFNIGHAAGAGHESHLHMHIVPRWYGDSNFMPVVSNKRIIPEALSATTSKLIEVYQKRYGN